MPPPASRAWQLGPRVITKGTNAQATPLPRKAGLQTAALGWARCVMTRRPLCSRSLGPLLRNVGTVTASPPRGSYGATRDGLALGTVTCLSRLTVRVTKKDSILAGPLFLPPPQLPRPEVTRVRAQRQPRLGRRGRSEQPSTAEVPSW